MSHSETQSPIRITPTFFYLLLTLADGRSHGYAMAQEVRERSDGAIDLGPGSLYWSLNRLAEVRLIEEVAADGTGSRHERRRYYELTEAGRAILQREVGTLAKVLDFARAKHVL